MQHLAMAALIFALVGMLAFGVPQLRAQTTCPPHTQGFWQSHYPSAWKNTGGKLTLGTTSYTNAQVESILQTSAGGDASLTLADQLIAALLNIANGTDPSPVSATITDANTLLGAGPIPEKVKPSSALGQKMVNDATILDNYNKGLVTQACASGPQPAAMELALSQSVVNGGDSLAFLVEVFDANDKAILPIPPSQCGITSRPGETSGTPPTLAGQTINTSNDTRGIFQLTCALSATALSATQQFVVIQSTGGGPSQAGLYGNFSKRLTDASTAMDQLVQALANGQLGAIPGLRNTLIAARDGVDLVAMQRSTPFAPEGGFPPTPDELTAKGFPPIPADATLQTVLTALIAKWEESAAFINNLNPLSLTAADIAQLNALHTELETLVAQLASLTPSANGVVATSSHFTQLLAITLPTSFYALVNKVDEVLRLNGLALNVRTPLEMYAAMLGGMPGSGRSARLTPTEYYSHIRPALSLSEVLEGLHANLVLITAGITVAIGVWEPVALFFKENFLLKPFFNDAALSGIVTNGSAIDVFYFPGSVIEGSVVDLSVDADQYDVILVGPDQIAIAQGVLSGQLCQHPMDPQELWSCFETRKMQIAVAGEPFGDAFQPPSPNGVKPGPCLLDPGDVACNRLIYDSGFKSVYHCSGFLCIPRPVLVLVHIPVRFKWASGIAFFAPAP